MLHCTRIHVAPQNKAVRILFSVIMYISTSTPRYGHRVLNFGTGNTNTRVSPLASP
jgi:hypothetical protein